MYQYIPTTNTFLGDLTNTSEGSEFHSLASLKNRQHFNPKQGGRCQYFFLRRNIGEVTPKVVFFHYLTKYFPDQSIQNTFHLILKTEALVVVSNSIDSVESYRTFLTREIQNQNILLLDKFI